MPNDSVDVLALHGLLDVPAVRKTCGAPPGTHDTGGDDFDDQKTHPQTRVDAVTRACLAALKNDR